MNNKHNSNRQQSLNSGDIPKTECGQIHLNFVTVL